MLNIFETYFFLSNSSLSALTEIPSEIWAMSEPLQIRHYESGQFHVHRHDSEAVSRDIPCCLYGDQDKQCRICRYEIFVYIPSEWSVVTQWYSHFTTVLEVTGSNLAFFIVELLCSD